MAMTKNPLNAYKETQIKTAGQGKLIIMLYDAAVRQVETAIHGLERGEAELDSVNNALVKAQDVVTELMVSLDFDRGGEIAQSLFNLYMFFNRQMIEANIKKDAQPLKEIRDMLNELRDAWLQIVDNENAPDPADGGGLNIAG